MLAIKPLVAFSKPSISRVVKSPAICHLSLREAGLARDARLLSLEINLGLDEPCTAAPPTPKSCVFKVSSNTPPVAEKLDFYASSSQFSVLLPDNLPDGINAYLAARASSLARRKLAILFLSRSVA